MRISDLEKVALTRAEKMNNEDLSKLLHVDDLLPKFCDLVPTLIADARTVSSYRGAERYFKLLILPIVSILTPDDLHQILDAVVENGQANDAGGMPEILAQIFDQTESIRDACKPHWQAFCTAIKDRCVSIDYDCLYNRLHKIGIDVPAREEAIL